MRIATVHGHAISFAFRSGGFTTSYGRRTHLANALLVLTAEDGAVGFGEVCQFAGMTPPPLDAQELANMSERCRRLLDVDSRDVAAAVGAMGDDAPANLRSGVDTALWDMMGRRTGQPLFRLFGGRRSERMAVYASLSSEPPDDMRRASNVARQQGMRCLQLKMEGKPELDIARVRSVGATMPDGERALADANGGLDVESAVAVSKALDGIDVLIEEPCSTFDENLEVARRVDHGVVLDQCMSSLQLYARAVGEGVFAGVGIKPTNLGGLTPARAARDLCLAAGLPMKIDDSWAADVGSLAALHLAAGVPAELLIATVDMRGYFDGAMFSGGPREGEGEICLNDAAGLGITPLPNSFGEPVFAAGA